MARYKTCSRRQREERERLERETNQERRLSEDGPDLSVIQRIQAFNGVEDDERDRFFIVERLLEKRYDLRGEEEYLVRWENYPPEYDSWEPRSELEINSMDMINEFNHIEGPISDTGAHCICKQPYRARSGGMIQCFTCSNWYHFSCLKMNMAEANSYARWHCDTCRVSHNLRNMIKREKVRSFMANTRLIDVKSEDQITINEDGQYLI